MYDVYWTEQAVNRQYFLAVYEFSYATVARNCIAVPAADARYRNRCRNTASISGPLHFLVEETLRNLNDYDLTGSIRFNGRRCYHDSVGSKHIVTVIYNIMTLFSSGPSEQGHRGRGVAPTPKECWPGGQRWSGSGQDQVRIRSGSGQDQVRTVRSAWTYMLCLLYIFLFINYLFYYLFFLFEQEKLLY